MGVRKYKVSGEDDVFGHPPGETFEIEYRDGQLIAPGGFEHSEDALLKAGLLKKVSRQPKEKDAGNAEKPDTSDRSES